MSKQMKQFSNNDLPDDVMADFLEQYDHIGNDCWVEFCVEWDDENPEEPVDPVTDWLRTKRIKNGDSVLIEHSW